MNEGHDSTATRRHPFFHLIAARVYEFWREPAAIFWVYVFPLIMVVALGVAFRNKPVGGFSVVISAGGRAQEVLTALERDERFRVSVLEEAESRWRLRTGRADLLIDAPPDAGSGYDYYFDPTQANSVLARHMADEILQRAAERQDAVAIRDHTEIEPGSRYIDFLVPGLLGMGLLGGGMWGVGFAIVDMRLRKLLKRYLATPMKRSHFLAALMTSRFLFTLPEVLILLLFARFLFGVTSQGSYWAVGLLIVLGTFEFAGIGLLVASRAQTIETVSGLMNAVMLPMWIGSGIFFSAERFPDSVQPFLSALPLTPLIVALRSVMLEGTSLFALGPQLALIVAWGVLPFLLALRCFRWN
jgi:ABC-type multidrug transport system permease subunit